MKDFKLGSATYLKSVAIRVKDRDKMIDFYKKAQPLLIDYSKRRRNGRYSMPYP